MYSFILPEGPRFVDMHIVTLLERDRVCEKIGMA